MFYNGRKTLGVFINRVELNFQRTIIRFLIEEAQLRNFNIAFMTSYGIRGSNNSYDTYENAIVDFAPIERFDAIIVAMDTYDTPEFRKKLINNLKERAQGPVITFRENCEDFYCVLTDSNLAVDTLVKHFAYVHNAKHICFMAGFEGHYDSEVRLKKYYSSMNKYGLSLYDNSVFHGDMWKTKGEEAYQYFFSDPSNKPDAIICANDFMARSLCDVLIRQGVRVPEDVMLSGFDNLPEVTEYEPSITTVAVDYKKMSQEAVELAYDLINGKYRDKKIYVPSRVDFHESCGCGKSDNESRKEKINEHYRRNTEFIHKHTKQMFFTIDMNECKSIDCVKTAIGKNLKLVGEYKDFYLCLVGNSDENGLRSLKGDLNARFEFGFRNGKEIKLENIKIENNELLPKEVADDEIKAYFFRLLHNCDENFGYTVISFKNPTDCLDIFYHEWNLTICLTLNDCYVTRRMSRLIKENEENSIRDPMTGMYNRRGLERYIYGNWESWVRDGSRLIFISMDMDGLKKINDTYGHIEGDRAICSVARVLQYSLNSYGITARMGGDEFIAVLVNEDSNVAYELERKIRKGLDDVNSCSTAGYTLRCSIGSYITKVHAASSYDECIRRSDMEMYRNKKSRRIDCVW